MPAKIIKVVLTGRPYSGKTSVLRELSRRGFPTAEESATVVRRSSHELHGLQKQIAIMEEQLRAEAAIERCSGPVFFDRGVVDILAYTEMALGRSHPHVHDILPSSRYDVVFWLEPLPWRSTRARRETSEKDATRVSSFLMECYERWGYGLLAVPIMTIAQRCDYILERLQRTKQLHDTDFLQASTATHYSPRAKRQTRRRSGCSL